MKSQAKSVVFPPEIVCGICHRMDSCKCTSAIGSGFTKELHSNGCSTSLGGFTQDFVDTHLVREKKMLLV